MPLEFDIATNDLIKIGIAVFCGALLGFERQYNNKTAGFRTIILISLGSTIFTMISQRAGQGVNINLVTGVGFIGAGVIFKDNISVNGAHYCRYHMGICRHRYGYRLRKLHAGAGIHRVNAGCFAVIPYPGRLPG